MNARATKVGLVAFWLSPSVAAAVVLASMVAVAWYDPFTPEGWVVAALWLPYAANVGLFRAVVRGRAAALRWARRLVPGLLLGPAGLVALLAQAPKRWDMGGMIVLPISLLAVVSALGSSHFLWRLSCHLEAEETPFDADGPPWSDVDR
jgi:hypothetical protein